MNRNRVLALLALTVIACAEGNGASSSGRGGAGGSDRDNTRGGTGQSAGSSFAPAGGASLAGSGSVSAGGNAGTAGTPGDLGTAGVTGCPAPIDLGVRFVGRYDGCLSGAVRFAWSGSGFVAAFNGTGLSVRLKGKANQFTLIVDGTLLPKLVTTEGDQTYVLATALAAGDHTLELYRRTEASAGFTSVFGVTVQGGTLNPPPVAPTRLIEVVGDSISCGYGNEGTAPCSFSADTENHYLSYGALLARSFGAEVSTVAWSGKGVASNYQGNKLDLIPLVYDRAVPSEKRSVWGFVPQPQLVLINLGTNDFSGSTDPTETEFVTAYQDLLTRIRAYYPSAYILCTVGPGAMMPARDFTDKARPFIAEAVQARRAAGDVNVEAYGLNAGNPDAACDGHPNLLTHAAMAEELAAKVKPILGW